MKQGRAKVVERIAQNMTSDEFSQLVRQYERLVYTICYQFTKDHQLAEDLAQETFLSAYTHRDDCPPGSYKPWLARIATNKAKDYLKSAYHRRVSAAEDGEMPAVADVLNTMPPPEDITIAKDEAARIRDTILALKEPYHSSDSVAQFRSRIEVACDHFRRFRDTGRSISLRIERARGD